MEQAQENLDIHDEPEFERKKKAFFSEFMVRHRTEARDYIKHGLLKEYGARSWRNVAKHQVLSGVMAETIMELMGEPAEEVDRVTHYSLIHDVDKRRQQEGYPEIEILKEEMGKDQLPISATSSNFTKFDSWGLDSYVLRYIDSSIGEKSLGYFTGARDAKNLPPVTLLPWRQRIQGFKDNKMEEAELGRAIYNGMTTWEKLEQIMTTIETVLYDKIIQKHPELSESYPNHSYLTQIVENRIHEKILAHK